MIRLTANLRIDDDGLPAAAAIGRSTVAAGTGVSEMAKQTETVICRFYQLIPDAPIPRPADRSADGMLLPGAIGIARRSRPPRHSGGMSIRR
jgi:hypothetical protein